MTSLRPHGRSAFVTIFLVLLLTSLACSTLSGGLPADSDQQEITINKDIAYGPGAFELADPKVGLSDLSSYQATLTITFDGTRDGRAEKWSKTYVMLTAGDPAARQLTIEKSGDIPDLDPVFRAELDGTDYEKRGEGACESAAIQAGNSLADRFEPALFLDGVIGADAAGSETVNDVATDKYTFDQRALGQQDVTESTGEIWIASEGGYIVKYLLTSKGSSVYFGEGIEGTLSLDYELTEVNGPVEIALPADCPLGLVDAPLLTDATNVLNMGGILAYDTASSVADAAAFYEEQMPGLGWKTNGKPTLQDPAAFLSYTKGDKSMTIAITSGQAGTEVRILVGPTQK